MIEAAGSPVKSPSRLSDFFDPGVDECPAKPGEGGSPLPNAAYTDDNFFALEQQTVFRRTWVFAGFAHRLQQVGDMLPVEVAGQPVVIVKSNAKQIKVFHNVCRHRGAQLVTEPKSGGKSIVCPNHAWSYGLDGRLLARPHFFGGDQHDINPETRHRADLVEIRSETWHDWIFINIDGQAPDFAEYLSFITERLAEYDFSELRFADKLEFDTAANWKLAIENFIEPYHVFSCHPWLHAFVGMAERTPPLFREHVLYCGYDFNKTDPARGQGLPYFPGLPEHKKRRGDWYVLFPNFAFQIFPDQVAVFIATPISSKRCGETIALYFNGEGADAPQYAEARGVVMQNWTELNHEDIGVIERMQAGRASEGFDGGVLSPYWDPVQRQFARLIMDSMGSD